MRDKIILARKGFLMGCDDIVPGVSGGTMAFILGIYQQLIAAVASFNTEMIKDVMRGDVMDAIRRPHWAFLVPLMLGIALALVFFTKIIPLPVLLDTHRSYIYALFFGLIAGSIGVLLSHLENFHPKDIIAIIAGVVIGLIVVNLVPVETPKEAWFAFLSGSLAITAMILPGISGSFILLILGQYRHVLGALSDFDLGVLIPFALGCATGLALFSRVIRWLLNKFHHVSLLVISGFLIGSLWAIWPYQTMKDIIIGDKVKSMPGTPILPAEINNETLMVFSLMVIGGAIVWGINKLAGKQRTQPAE